MENLVALLNALDRTSLPNNDGILTPYHHPLVTDIENAACDLLVSSDGEVQYDMLDVLFKKHGYFVFPGDRDRYGWLTGCIRTKKGVVVFG